MWQALIRLFRRPQAPVPTLEQKIESAIDDRDLMRLAAEALRARKPELAHAAYWRATQIYLSQQHLLKALAVLNTILRFAPNDGNAHLVRLQTLEYVGRRRDAAFASVQAAQLFHAYGDFERAQWLMHHAYELDPAVAPPPQIQVVLGTPSQDLPMMTTSNTGVIELDIGSTTFEAQNVADPLADAQTSMSFDALPSAMLGTEHEEVARGYLSSSIPESATRAYDQSELSALLDEADAA